MPKELFETVKTDIPEHIGVYIDGSYIIKRAKKQNLLVDEKILKDSLIRSLFRETEKLYKSNDPKFIDRMQSRIRKLERERDEWREKYYKLFYKGYEKYGDGWYE